MDSLLNELPVGDHHGRHSSSPLKSPPCTTSSAPSGQNHELSAQEEKLSKMLIERVLPPFSKSMRLQALVVYQADREKMNCLLVNRTYEKQGTESDCPQHFDGRLNGSDEASDLSDSGYMEYTAPASAPDTSPDPIRMTVAMNGITDSGESATERIDPGQSVSRRKRKLCRPCRIPQNGPPLAPDPFASSNPEVELKVSQGITTSATISSSTTVVAPTNNLANEVISFPAKSISDSLLLPVTAVTLLPRVSVFSLPVTVLSTLPRPILPRLAGNSNDKLSAPVSINTSGNQSTSVVFAATGSTLPISTAQATNRTHEPTVKLEPSRGPTNAAAAAVPVTDASNSVLNRRFGKSFLCNQCRRDFSSLSQLCAHTFAVHRCFRCTICGAQFTQRSNLQRHSLRHVGFKPFVCKVCEKAYYRKDHLVRHIELSHPGRDPRLSLTVKLSSAECLDYLERLQSDGKDVEQMNFVCATSDDEPNHGNPSPVQDRGSPEEARLVVESSQAEPAVQETP